MASRLRIAVTGDERFAARHHFLFKAIAERCGQLDYVTSASRTRLQRLDLLVREIWFVLKRILTRRSRPPLRIDDLRLLRREFILSRACFKSKSLSTQQNLQRLANRPQVVFHIFGLYRPFWQPSSIPFVQYLDFTTALARRNWPPNLPTLGDADYAKWFALEQETFRRAAHLFTMSAVTADSLVRDYAISPARVTTVGSSGQFRAPFSGVKTFGTKQILFNGNPFGLKGGDIVLSAFEIVRRKMPDAKLIVIGIKLHRSLFSVTNPGFVADTDAMQRLFLESDIVVAPARADAFPGFLIEAMSHGVPCIASAVGGISEIIDDGINGTIVEAPTAHTLAHAILALLGDSAKLESFSRAARDKVSQRFTWALIAEAILAQLELIVTSRESIGS